MDTGTPEDDKDRNSIGEELFKKFEEIIGDDHNQKMTQGLIEDNEEFLNGRYGKRQETPLHRYYILK